MNTDSIYALMDAVIVGSGVYVIYLYLVMAKSGKLKQNILTPQNVDIKKCKDVAGYIHYVGRKQLVFGIVAILCGGIGLLQDYTKKIGAIPYMIAITIFFVYALWFGFQIKKAVKMFW
ncbi:MAG: hypothetical protein MR871_00610 [Lachnospiraceae bacterium]|nr:hypothetical protein [Lachnospiraceae bacterium]MDD7078421.1 hypothetical protein [Lachnospiraceae bacterium]MDY3729895.1 hypothetical protein [Candidatus Choladocola sp.]